MDKTILVRMTGADGQPFPEHLLTSLYASDPHFEPDIRQLRVTSGGECELVVTANPFYLHARVDLPQYGNIWVMADNGGAGFRDGPVDFVRAAVETYRREAARLYAEACVAPSVPVAAHMAAAEEYDRLADAGADPGYCRLKALSHAVMAAEDALFETSSDRLAGKGRPDLLLGCNLFKYPGPSKFEDYFLDTFNFATLPFYHNQVAPTEHGPLDFARRDELAGWCADHGVVAKGHPLWFGHGDTNPGWMTGKSYAELSAFARKAAKECVSRYRGRVIVWDAINEPHDWANCFGFTQPELLDLAHVCCNAVREADPDVTSLINVCLPFAEYVAGRFNRWGPVQDRPMSPLRYLENAIDDGVDFDAVGVQLYFPARDMLAVSRILDEFARFGKPVHITEMGVPSRPFEHASHPTGAASSEAATALEARAGHRIRYTDPQMADPKSQIGLTRGVWRMGWNEHTQADWLERFYTIAAARPEIQALTWWDFMDPGFMLTSPFLYDDQVPREMLFRLQALKDRLGIQNARKTQEA